MDHLIEHEGEPIPADGGSTAAAGSSAADPMNVDDDEDDEDLRAALKLSKGVDPGSTKGEDAAGAEAKVCCS
jgi:hypothetical protein